MATLELDQDLAQRLIDETIAFQLSMKSFGNSKNLDEECHSKVAKSIEANPESLRTKRILIDESVAEYKAITKFQSSVRTWFDKYTIPYFLLKGVRLAHQNKSADIIREFESKQRQLRDLVWELDQVRDSVLACGRRNLQQAFDESLYPESFASDFEMTMSNPSIGPDTRLQQLNPALFEEQQRRFAAQMDLVMQQTTEEMTNAFTHILTQLSDSITNGRRLKADAFNPLQNFLERFESLKIGTSPQLQELVAQAQQIMASNPNTENISISHIARTNLATALTPVLNQTQTITEPVLPRGSNSNNRRRAIRF